ncbi:uncharacterized protein C5orf34 homolog isoform X2 [Engraulis encrasicolus]|uniref:uncharacterized protein C5orf34 homolog isoform X2 n=1 Tax=Engraulis encrasicolus TaxID=184585 RepID=UPI002FD420B6
MATVRLMTMYESEAVDVYYTDGSRLYVSPCGSEFVLEKALPQGAHPLQAGERIRQRTRFAISDYKALLKDALKFRNKYATHPYLPEELISTNQQKWIHQNISEITWPAESSLETTRTNQETILKSSDGMGRLLLSVSGEEFHVEFYCMASQREGLKHSVEEYSSNQNKTHMAHLSTTRTDEVTRDGEPNGCTKNGPVIPSTTMETQNARPGQGYLFTTVVQHHSCASYPPKWHYPLTLAIRQWRTQQENPTENGSVATPEAFDSQTCQTPCTDVTPGVKSSLPESLPLRCNSPHMHRWNSGSSPLNEQPDEATATELVKVLWCQGVIYRIICGTVPIIEISPGDGSVIRSNGVLASYFTHYKAGCGLDDRMEITYFLSNLPPDIPGQKYSVSSVVTRANRVLECYNQARDSLKLTQMNCCWRKEVTSPEPLKLVQEAHVADWGHFLAFSDGSAEALFLDGVKVHSTWKTSGTAPAQMVDPSSWSQLTMPNGHQLLLQSHTPGPYKKYLSMTAEWCSWVAQTCLSPDQACSTQSANVESNQTAQSRSVVAELEKIKRLNFLLDNSHLITTHTSSKVPPEDSRMPGDITHMDSEASISEALRKTSQAIRDIDTLLSHKQYTSNNPV